MRCGSASFSSSNPLRIPRPKIDKLAYQVQGVGILATGEISSAVLCNRAYFYLLRAFYFHAR